MKKEYEIPQIKSPGSYSEPIESGCCLRGCGGSPGVSWSGNTLEGRESALDILENATI